MIQKKMVRATDIVRILPVNSEIENYKGYYYDYGLFVILVSIGQFTVWNLNCLPGHNASTRLRLIQNDAIKGATILNSNNLALFSNIGEFPSSWILKDCIQDRRKKNNNLCVVSLK